MIRSFNAQLEMSGDDGRTVIGRMFPFGETAHVRERNPDTGEVEEYDEGFLPGCTARMRQAAAQCGTFKWLRFTHDHRDGLPALIGCCQAMEEQPHGVIGTFRLYESNDLVKVQSMIRESHTGLSVEFRDTAPPRVSGALRERRQIHVDAVTITPIPVYTSARVLAVRADDDPYNGLGTPNLDKVRELLATL